MTENAIKNVARPDFLSDFTPQSEKEILGLLHRQVFSSSDARIYINFPKGNPFECIGVNDCDQRYEVTVERKAFDLEKIGEILRNKGRLRIRKDAAWLEKLHFEISLQSFPSGSKNDHAISFAFREDQTLESAVAFMGDLSSANCGSARLTRSLALELLGYVLTEVESKRSAYDRLGIGTESIRTR